MKFNIFKNEAGRIEEDLNKNNIDQIRILTERKKLDKAEREAQAVEADLEGEKITTQIASEDFEQEQTEKQAKITQLKSDLETKIAELEKLGLDAEPLKQALENLTVEKSENIEGGLLFEWGPDVGKMSWHDAQERIAELNKWTLKEGEKPWRLPTKEEWEEVLKPFREAQEKGASREELIKILEEIRKEHNLQSAYYWSSTTNAESSDCAWIVYMSSGYVYNDYKDGASYLVRCVR